MPYHFLDLPGATTVQTNYLALTRRAVLDVARHRALGVIHGPAGLGKTFAVEEALGHLGPEWETAWVSFPARPSMRLIVHDLWLEITGVKSSKNRFALMHMLKAELSATQRVLVVDEAQALSRECIECIRHLNDHRGSRCGVVLVGGDGCWEVLSREPMLRSRVFRRVQFGPLTLPEVIAKMTGFHSIYAAVSVELLSLVDDECCRGNFRSWASFTLTASALCEELGRPLDEAVVRNAFALLAGAGRGR